MQTVRFQDNDAILQENMREGIDSGNSISDADENIMPQKTKNK